MAHTFIDATGFEAGSAGYEDDGGSLSAFDGASTSHVRTGTYAGRAFATNSTAFIQRRHPAGSANVVQHFRLGFYPTANPANNLRILHVFVAATATLGVRCILNSDGTVQIADNAATPANIGSPSAACVLNDWNILEIKGDWSLDTVSARLNGVEFVKNGTVTPGFDSDAARIGEVSSTSGLYTIWFDDYVHTDAVAADDYLKDIHIVNIRPDSAGDNAAWTNNGTTPNWDCINEVPPDDATTYISSSTNNQLSDNNCLASSTFGIQANDEILCVFVLCCVACATAASSNYNARIKSQASGTVVSGTTTTVAVTAWNPNDDTAASKRYKLIQPTDPQSGGKWTPALLDSMQLGVSKGNTNTAVLRVTAIMGVVAFVPGKGKQFLPTQTTYRTLRKAS